MGEDGHPKRGGFLPPVPLPRRMFAGARLQFHRPLRAGDAITRKSTIADVSSKSGKSGTLMFVLVRHEISDEQGLAITEENDLVYREQPAPGAPAPKPQPAPADAQWSRRITPNEVMLFRYSALNFNAHRIHYDLPYATNVEGYPGLVVHGVLIATHLADLVRRSLPDSTLTQFAFRAAAPLFNTAPFTVNARQEDRQLKLWAANATGGLAMDASAILA